MDISFYIVAGSGGGKSRFPYDDPDETGVSSPMGMPDSNSRREAYLRDYPEHKEKYEKDGYYRVAGYAPWFPDIL